MRRLFVDASGWVALNYPRDRSYKVATAALRGFVKQPSRLVTTDYVLDEALTFLRARMGHATAVLFGTSVRRDPAVERVHIDEALWAEAWELFVRYDDKEFSFTDCTSFAVMRSRGLVEAFTFDEHFRQAGYQMWPSVPPS